MDHSDRYAGRGKLPPCASRVRSRRGTTNKRTASGITHCYWGRRQGMMGMMLLPHAFVCPFFFGRPVGETLVRANLAHSLTNELPLLLQNRQTDRQTDRHTGRFPHTQPPPLPSLLLPLVSDLPLLLHSSTSNYASSSSSSPAWASLPSVRRLMPSQSSSPPMQ